MAKSYARRFEDRYRKIRQEFDVGEDEENDEEDNDGGGDRNSSKKVSSATKTPKSSSSASNLSDSKSSPSSSATSKPPLDARAQFGSNLFLLSGMELGHVISACEDQCPECLENVRGAKGNGDCHIEINVDLIPSKVFDVLNAYVSGKVGGGGNSGNNKNGNSGSSRSASPTSENKKGQGRPKKKQKKE